MSRPTVYRMRTLVNENRDEHWRGRKREIKMSFKYLLDEQVRLHDLERGQCSRVFTSHSDRVKAIEVENSNPNMLWSSGEDGLVFQYDLRTEEPQVLVQGGEWLEFKSITVNQVVPFLVSKSIQIGQGKKKRSLIQKNEMRSSLVSIGRSWRIGPVRTHLRQADAWNVKQRESMY